MNKLKIKNTNGNKISILGCGWLGLPLAQSLLSKGYEVKGSTTSESKLEILENVGVLPFQIKLEAHQIIGTIKDFLKVSDVLVIAIPPGLRKEVSSSNEMTFVNKIKTLIPFIEKSGIEKVLFVSTTSVYGDSFPIVEITEDTKPNPESESGKQLVIAETLLQSNPHFKTTVIRFGGLIGEDRNPVYQLQYKTISNPDAPINLIHQMDCIGIIEAIIKLEKWGEIYNASGIHSISRRKYYTEKSKNSSIHLHFNEKNKSKGKQLISEKIKNDLQYIFCITS